jgi:hypothetical protein
VRTRADKLAIVVLSMIAIALGGCAHEPDVEFVAQAVANVNPTAPAKETAPGNSEIQLAAAADKPEATEKDAAFEAPFPDRVDLFLPPKREGGPAASQGAGDGSVELVGFVKLDRLRALLSVNGELAPVAEGETQFGIEVISVKPPNVVLQRGRQRWQASLE